MSMNPRAQTRMTAWVACADELPAFFDGPILVHFKNGAIETVNCEDFFKPMPNGVDADGKQLYVAWAMVHPLGVTHWALCPDPPHVTAMSVPPMPELDWRIVHPLDRLGAYATELESWGRDLASRLSASQALAGELAEALECVLKTNAEGKPMHSRRGLTNIATSALAKFRSSQPQA